MGIATSKEAALLDVLERYADRDSIVIRTEKDVLEAGEISAPSTRVVIAKRNAQGDALRDIFLRNPSAKVVFGRQAKRRVSRSNPADIRDERGWIAHGHWKNSVQSAEHTRKAIAYLRSFLERTADEEAPPDVRVHIESDHGVDGQCAMEIEQLMNDFLIRICISFQSDDVEKDFWDLVDGREGIMIHRQHVNKNTSGIDTVPDIRVITVCSDRALR